MKIKVVAHEINCRELVAEIELELSSSLVASRFHGDFWNANFAATDRFRSQMYIFDEGSRRWHKTETIN